MWIVWGILGIMALNVLFFGTLEIMFLIERRQERKNDQSDGPDSEV